MPSDAHHDRPGPSGRRGPASSRGPDPRRRPLSWSSDPSSPNVGRDEDSERPAARTSRGILPVPWPIALRSSRPRRSHARLGAPDLRLVDVRWVLGSPGAGRAAYDAGHLPGAIFLDLDTDLAAAVGPGRHPLPAPADFRERLEAAGIGAGDEVVAYDDAGGSIAARLWWMLDDLGHERVRVLDGGLPAWLAAGFPVTTDPPDPRPRGRLALRDAWTNVIDRHERRRAARRGRAPRCPRRPALPGRDRADRPGRRPHPDRPARAGRRQPRARRSAAPGRPSWPSGSARSARRRRRPGRDLVRERRHRLLQQPGDARRRPARSDPLPRVVQRLEPVRDAGRGRAGAGRPTGRPGSRDR